MLPYLAVHSDAKCRAREGRRAQVVPPVTRGRLTRGTGDPTQHSPALRRDERVAHVQDAHVRVALHVLLPVHVVVLNDICRAEGTG